MLKKNKLAIIFAVLSGITFLVATLMLSSGDPYFALFGYFMLVSAIVIFGTLTLLAWAWGRPAHEASMILIGGAVVAVALYFGALAGTQWIATGRKDAKEATWRAIEAKDYRSAHIYSYFNSTYNPQANKIRRRSPTETNLASESVIVIPFGNDFALVLQGRNAWAFDGNSSSSVQFDRGGQDADSVSVGHFIFRNRRYETKAISNGANYEGYDQGGDGELKNPPLLDAIAPTAPAP
jgi:hypothetical protein